MAACGCLSLPYALVTLLLQTRLGPRPGASEQGAIDDEPNVPFGGVLASGTGARFGGTANLEAFTDTRWVTIRGDIAKHP
jgi:hypothetical protein